MVCVRHVPGPYPPEQQGVEVGPRETVIYSRVEKTLGPLLQGWCVLQVLLYLEREPDLPTLLPLSVTISAAPEY